MHHWELEMSEVRRLYANTVRISTTPHEFVLEFGTFLPKSDAEAKAGPPQDFNFDAQVLMNPNQLDALVTSLQDVQKRLAAARAAQNVPLKRSTN
jgi:hypothetical protein